MAITPDTDLYLIKCDLEIDNQNQINFASKSAQANHFLSLPKIGVENYSYQRKDGVIRMEGHVDNLRNFNYVMYKNNNYSDKWFFAFITNMQYLSDNSTAVSIKTDVYQTWQFDLTWKQTFVEREHVNNDAIGANVTDENIGTGEYMVNGVQDVYSSQMTGSDENFYLVVQVTELPYIEAEGMRDRLMGLTSVRAYNGVIQGCYSLVHQYNTYGLLCLTNLIRWYDVQGKQDAIVAMFAIPASSINMGATTTSNWITSTVWYEDGAHAVQFGVPSTDWTPKDMGTTTVSRNTTLNGYTPKNNKMFTYPYNYMLISNNAGKAVDYRWEDFSNKSSAQFKGKGALAQGSSVVLYPLNYKGGNESASWMYGIEGAKFPTISWQSDYYLNWVAQNSQRMNYDVAYSVVGAVTNTAQSAIMGGAHGGQAGAIMGATTGAIGGVLNVAQTIQGNLNQQHVAEITPPQVKGNVSCGDVSFSNGKLGFSIYKMSIRQEFAKKIDDYFTMYGYRVDQKKVPNITGRRNWNYVKTIGANIEGFIPQEDMQEIKDIFNRGVTIWHNANTYLDYSQDNSIV